MVTEAVRDANAVMEHLQKQAESEQTMLRGAIVFAVLCVIVLVVLFMNHVSWRKHSMGKISDGDSIHTAIAKFRLNISNAAELSGILEALRKKVHGSPEAALGAARGGLAALLIECVQDARPSDERLPLVLGILNELWAVPAVRQHEHQHNSTEFLHVVDSLVRLYKRLSVAAAASELEPDEEPDEHSSFFSKKKKLTFASYEYKFVMALGMASIDSVRMQSRVGDKGGIDCIIDSLESNSEDSRIVKWGCWSLVYLCISHPPNKRALVQRGGIPMVLHALSLFPEDQALNHQGFAVLFSLLADDPQTKVSISDCRQMALANGVVDLCQNCQARFRSCKELQGLTASVLDLLVAEYS